jgi:hypothetical protein
MNQSVRRTLSSTIAACVGLAICVAAGAAHADFVTDGFGGKDCSKPGTMTIERSKAAAGPVLTCDLSAIPKSAEVYRAVLKVVCNRGRNYRSPVLFRPLERRGDGTPAMADKALPLRPPFYQDFDATGVVRKWVADPKSNLGLIVASAPGWKRERTKLLVSYEGKGKPGPAVSGLEASFLNGQVFLRFKEIEDVVGAETIKFADFERKVLDAWKRRHVVYRIYRHTERITGKNIGRAELYRELEEIRPAYNLDAIPTTEHPGKNSRGSRVAPGGNRRLDVNVRRFRIPMEKQLTSGENLAVMTARENGPFYYAVTAVVDGYEAVRTLGPGNSLAEPVKERVEAVGPLLQSKTVRKRRRREEVYERYVCFYEPPYWPTPIRVEMCSAYDKRRLDEKDVPLEICTGTYGGQAPYNLGRRHVPNAYYVAPPVMMAMGQGVHECIGTLKSYDDGLVRNCTHRQVIALTRWARKKWPNIDADRVCINGQFAMWALRHADVFAVVTADPYGNFAAGKEMVRWGWAWGPFPQGSKNEDGMVDQWEYLNIAKWIRENPKTELPFFCGKASSASHVGDMGFMPAPETYKALLDTRRAFAAHWGPSQGFGGPPPAARFPIRRGQAVPAFSNCSLDDMIGEGDQWGGAAGGTIGSGDPWGRFNADLRWSFDDITDRPDAFACTVWLQAGARKPNCTVDLTPRRCQRFEPDAGRKFTWSNTVLPSADEKADEPGAATEQAGEPVQSGSITADRHGLVTIRGLKIGKQHHRISITAE